MKLIMHSYPKVKIILLQVRAEKLLICHASLCAVWGHWERSVWRAGLNAPQVNYCLFEMPYPWKIISALKKMFIFTKYSNRQKPQWKRSEHDPGHIRETWFISCFWLPLSNHLGCSSACLSKPNQGRKE